MKGNEKYDIRSPQELIDFGMSIADAISYFNIFQYYKKCGGPKTDLEHEYNMNQQSIIMKSIIQQAIKNKIEKQAVDKKLVFCKWKNDR
jgi:hypothetical protein